MRFSSSSSRWAMGVALAAGLALTGLTPASAAPSIEAALAKAQPAPYPGERHTQYYRRGGGGGAAVAAGIVGGLAAGALIGGMAAQAAPAPAYPVYGPPPPVYPVYAAPPPAYPAYGRDPHWVNYCASHYPGFDPVSGTYPASDGYRYPCR